MWLEEFRLARPGEVAGYFSRLKVGFDQLDDRRLPFLSNKAKIETSVPIGVRDEEVEVHGKSDCGYFE